MDITEECEKENFDNMKKQALEAYGSEILASQKLLDKYNHAILDHIRLTAIKIAEKKGTVIADAYIRSVLEHTHEVFKDKLDEFNH